MKQVSGGNRSKSGQTEPMSIEEVRALPSFSDWDDQQISELLSTVSTYVTIVYGVWERQQKAIADRHPFTESEQYQIISLDHLNSKAA